MLMLLAVFLQAATGPTTAAVLLCCLYRLAAYSPGRKDVYHPDTTCCFSVKVIIRQNYHISFLDQAIGRMQAGCTCLQDSGKQ
jgi:hypothetical protein